MKVLVSATPKTTGYFVTMTEQDLKLIYKGLMMMAWYKNFQNLEQEHACKEMIDKLDRVLGCED